MRSVWISLGLAVLPVSTSAAQAAKPEPVKDQVQAFVKAYTDAANRADVGAYVAMYRESPDLIVISQGELKRGWASVRDEANQMLGTEGAFKISTQQGVQQLKGSMTLVLEKTGSKWLIIHDHTSYQQPQQQ